MGWLVRAGVPPSALIKPEPIRLAHGVRADDGRFDPEPAGPAWLHFVEHHDSVFWRPESGELATWNGRCFALGEQAIDSAGTCSLGGYLTIYNNPLRWLKGGRDGCVIIDWRRAFDRLRDVPRIAVQESLLPLYRKHMRPARMPELYVLREREGAVA
ncbi:hypothetical protein [Ensifer sp. 22460]|uniref:hypothetical protein n=1 Tax=Ensifer sp. 22460 TaxID=3453922 RepID=UPI003F86F91F